MLLSFFLWNKKFSKFKLKRLLSSCSREINLFFTSVGKIPENSLPYRVSLFLLLSAKISCCRTQAWTAARTPHGPPWGKMGHSMSKKMMDAGENLWELPSSPKPSFYLSLSSHDFTVLSGVLCKPIKISGFTCFCGSCLFFLKIPRHL